MNDTVKAILERNDADPPQSVEQIARALDLSAGYVYSILRDKRPRRKRKQHRQWSPYREKIAGLFAAKKTVREIADLLGVTTACVYKHMPKAPPPCPVKLPQ